jgi:hypothetical protein
VRAESKVTGQHHDAEVRFQGPDQGVRGAHGVGSALRPQDEPAEGLQAGHRPARAGVVGVQADRLLDPGAGGQPVNEAAGARRTSSAAISTKTEVVSGTQPAAGPAVRPVALVVSDTIHSALTTTTWVSYPAAHRPDRFSTLSGVDLTIDSSL